MKSSIFHGFSHSIIELNKLGSSDIDNQNNSDYKNDDRLGARLLGEKTFEIIEIIISDDSSDNTCRIVDEIETKSLIKCQTDTP